MRIINEENEQVGIIPIEEAINLAKEAGLDLVEVAPQGRPPVCRLMDYGKYKYRQNKRVRKGQHHENQLKEVRLRPKTDSHDREIIMRRAREFLSKGNKVQFTMLFRGRERFHVEIGHDIFREVAETMTDIAKIDRAPKMEGPRRLTMVLSPGLK